MYSIISLLLMFHLQVVKDTQMRSVVVVFFSDKYIYIIGGSHIISVLVVKPLVDFKSLNARVIHQSNSCLKIFKLISLLFVDQTRVGEQMSQC